MTKALALRLALGLILAMVISVRVFYHAKAIRNLPKSTFLESRFNIAARIIAAITGFVVLIAYLISPAAMAWFALPFPSWLRWMGAAIGIVAAFGLMWVHRSLGENFSGNLHVQTDHQLVTSGPYRWVRHPMYTVFYGLAISFFLLTANWFIGLSWFIVLTIVVTSRLAREEAAMIGLFGDQYREYASHTGRLLPRIRRQQSLSANPISQ